MTIRRVSEKTGASRMALYRHVRDKSELLELVADEISWQAIPRTLDEAADWQDRLRAIAYGLREKFEANPAFLELIILRPTHGRGAIAMSELMTRTIASTGLPAERVVHYTLVFTDIVLGRIQREISGDPTRGARNKPLVDAAVASGEAPFVTLYESEWRNVVPDDVFATEVKMVIDAIRAETDAGSRSNTPPAL